MHWHGVLLPNEQDGVPYITTPPIRPGQTHTYEFRLRHAGTYWYHSHTHLQEQSGVFGSIVVVPEGGEPVATDRDQVLVLSDWTNERPEEVMRTLRRGSDYYGLKRGNAPSIVGAARRGALGEYFAREWSRMNAMDVSDVGYDAFLINGQRETQIDGLPGQRVRLRIVNASAATYFYLQSSAGPLTVIAADGPPVEPVEVDRLFMAIAETYDVVVAIPEDGRWELRATAQDGSGHASAYFGDGTLHPAEDPPRPDIYSMDEMLTLALAEQDDDPRASLDLPRPGPPYRVLRAVEDTSLRPGLTRRKISLHLTGDMTRYVWSFDGKTVAQDPYVMIRRGEVVELELVNDTMMHHPIHLHGHFFRVLAGQGRRSPLKHTVDVPPMGRRTLEFEANEEEDWMFHCHILYHMMAGMARVFRYEPGVGSGKGAVAPPMAGFAGMAGGSHAGSLGEHGHEPWAAFGAVSLMSNMAEGEMVLMDARNDLIIDWEAGWQEVDGSEFEADVLYQRYFNPNLQAYAGVRLTDDPDRDNRAVAGLRSRLPLFVWASLDLDSEGDARLALAKRFQVTPRVGVFGRFEYDTEGGEEWAAGADVTLAKPVSLILQHHSDYGFGAGLTVRF
jgi:FtsP/CotA-like multicopper oxidase with cupredoxin domain